MKVKRSIPHLHCCESKKTQEYLTYLVNSLCVDDPLVLQYLFPLTRRLDMRPHVCIIIQNTEGGVTPKILSFFLYMQIRFKTFKVQGVQAQCGFNQCGFRNSANLNLKESLKKWIFGLFSPNFMILILNLISADCITRINTLIFLKLFSKTFFSLINFTPNVMKFYVDI